MINKKIAVFLAFIFSVGLIITLINANYNNNPYFLPMCLASMLVLGIGWWMIYRNYDKADEGTK